jgi:hypothetical protein
VQLKIRLFLFHSISIRCLCFRTNVHNIFWYYCFSWVYNFFFAILTRSVHKKCSFVWNKIRLQNNTSCTKHTQGFLICSKQLTACMRWWSKITFLGKFLSMLGKFIFLCACKMSIDFDGGPVWERRVYKHPFDVNMKYADPDKEHYWFKDMMSMFICLPSTLLFSPI